jgi:16S rRNA (guanine(966)-N(2))-methyltransferase RsmD
MRVIAGELRGRRLLKPRFRGIRPTADRVRETLFNVLGDCIVDAKVLDGYAGTGAVGIEALSRGAADVAFVELDQRAVSLIKENLTRCGVEKRSLVLRGRFERIMASQKLAREFDFVFLDPPYDENVVNISKALSLSAGRLGPNGLMVIEQSRRALTTEISGLERTRSVYSGDSQLTFYRLQTQKIAVKDNEVSLP